MRSSPSISARQRWPVCRCHGNVRINPACCSPSTDIYNHPELHVRLLTSHHNRMLLNSCKIPEPLISEHVTDVYSRVNLFPTGTLTSDCSCQSRYVKCVHTHTLLHDNMTADSTTEAHRVDSSLIKNIYNLIKLLRKLACLSGEWGTLFSVWISYSYVLF